MALSTTMMADLQTNASTYADNAMTNVSPLNQYLAFGSIISNPRMVQSLGGLGYIPQIISPL